MVYPQNQGLSDAVDEMQALNEQVRNRPVTPYLPPNVGPSGRRTYGGGYGRMAPPPGGGLFGGPPVTNQAAPLAQSLGFAPTTQAGYDEQMAVQNPGGRFFGGSLPAYGTSSGGNVRPMFIGPPQDQAGGVTPEMQRQWALKNGYYVNKQGTMSPNNNVQNGSTGYDTHSIAAMQISGRGPNYQPPADLAARQAAYQQRTAANMAKRKAGVLANAKQRNQAGIGGVGGSPLARQSMTWPVRYIPPVPLTNSMPLQSF